MNNIEAAYLVGKTGQGERKNKKTVSNIENSNVLKPCKASSEKFLTLLDEEAKEFTFQTFDDSDQKRPALTKVLHGTLDELWNLLVELNKRGAGIFVTVNRTDLKGRKAENIIGIRAVFKEDDRGGTPSLPLEPQIVVQSSPGKCHEYLLTESDCINEFASVQQRIVDDYGSDPNAKDVSRVLRLPGFYHMKKPEQPHLVKVIHNSCERNYTWDEIKEALPPLVRKSVKSAEFQSGKFNSIEIESALSVINPDCEYGDWIKIGMEIHHESGGSKEGFILWDDWSQKGKLYPKDPALTGYKWLSFSDNKDHPATIKSLFSIAYKAGWKGLKLNRDEFLQMIDSAETEDIDKFLWINELIGKSDLTKAEKGLLYKAIKVKTGMNITDLRADNAIGKEDLTEQQLAEETLELLGSENLIFSDSWFFLWNDSGIWSKEDDIYIKKVIHNLCKQKDYPYTAGLVDAVTKLIKTESYKRGHVFDADKDIINCLNGELHFQDGKWQLLSHNKTSYRTTQIPVAYDPDAKAERFQQFLHEVFQGDDDAVEKSQIVMEAIGYSLMTTCKFEKFFMLIGSGANGKSVLLGVLEALLGRVHVCAVQPNQFDNRFQRAHLHGKLANIVTEIAEGGEIADDKLKAIVSGELTTAEHKMKPPFDFHPFSTCWFGTNHMPHTRDFSDALFRRAIILQFNNKFEGKVCDPNLKGKLMAELPGILVLALNAIVKVLKNGRFSECKSNIEAKEKWRLEADQVGRFIEECCEKVVTEIIMIDELYKKYKMWAQDSGIREPLGKIDIGNRLEIGGFPRGRKTQGRFIRGLMLKGVKQ